jgi:hypothetical protein
MKMRAQLQEDTSTRTTDATTGARRKPRVDLEGRVVTFRRGRTGPLLVIDVGDRELWITIDRRSAVLLMLAEGMLRPLQRGDVGMDPNPEIWISEKMSAAGADAVNEGPEAVYRAMRLAFLR